MRRFWLFSLLFSLFIFLFASAGNVLAGGCAYSGARMAMERGNTMRGMALMRMASRDGDPRAVQFLAARNRDAGGAPEALSADLRVAWTSATVEK